MQSLPQRRTQFQPDDDWEPAIVPDEPPGPQPTTPAELLAEGLDDTLDEVWELA